MTARRLLIVGATSAIAEAVAREYAAANALLVVTGRSYDRVAQIATNLSALGAAMAIPVEADPTTKSGRDQIVESVSQLHRLDAVLIAFGTLPAQQQCVLDPESIAQGFRVNAESVVILAERLAPLVADSGVLAVITSVAGERGRATNYAYGAAKAAVSAFLEGLRQRERGRIGVLDVRPGVIDTPMLPPEAPRGRLVVQPEVIAPVIRSAMERRARVVRVPWRWNLIMAIVRNMPWALFAKTRF